MPITLHRICAFLILHSVSVLNFSLLTNAAGDVICPPNVLIFPCACVESAVECSGFDNHEELEDIFQDLSYLEFPILRILNSRIQYIPHTVFEFARFHEIYVGNSNLSSLFNNTPSSEVLEKFIVDNCYFDYRIKGDMFANLSITSLDFINNGMTGIRRYLTDGLPKTLLKLSIHEPRLHNLSIDCLEGANSLEELNIQHGTLRRMNKIKFPHTIKIINLRNNKIEYLPDGIFDGLPNLSEVILEKNLLTTLKKEVFASVPRLFILKNPVMCNCSLKWLTESDNRTYVITGKCASPFSFYDRDINQLTSHDFISCLWRD